MSFVTDSLELIESLQSQLHAAQQEKHSFARSQAIGFNKWCDGLTDDQRYGNDYEFLYKKFLLYQKKQQEGKGE